MPQLKRLTLDEILKSLRKRRRKRERLQRLAQSPKTPQSYSPYYTDSIFAGVTIDEPKDLGLNYIDSAFKTLITGPKRLEVRGVFCAYLMSYDVNTARIETVKRYGI